MGESEGLLLKKVSFQVLFDNYMVLRKGVVLVMVSFDDNVEGNIFFTKEWPW